MADVNGKSNESGANLPGDDGLAAASARVLENLAELEPQLIAGGIFDSERNPVATTSDSPTWAREAAALLEALEAGSGEEEFDSAHVASTEGEVFAVAESGLSLVAVTGRFVLASLTSYDMRMALRDVVRSNPRNPASEAGNGGSDDA